MYQKCMSLYHNLEKNPNLNRLLFLQVAANVRYYSSAVVEEIKRQHRAGFKGQVDGKDREQIPEELCLVDKRVPDWDYRNVCWNTLNYGRSYWDYATSSLCIALPSDLESWNDSDPLTHRFRLYFLCENHKSEGARKDMPQHVHISNHPGYRLNRPQEFFQTFGDHILRILHLVQHGYSDDRYEIPPLATLKILWNCDHDVVGNYLTKETLIPLVEKAITHLQDLSPPKTPIQALTRAQVVMIRKFLETQESDTGESSLISYATPKMMVFWMCQSHAHQNFDQAAMEDLEEFVLGHEGNIDKHHSTLRVELGSSEEADQFRILLTAVKHVFEISIKLSWKATRLYVKDLCLDVAKTGTVILELDGITLDSHPQGHVQYTSDLFSDDIMANNRLQFITLLNYPQPLEQRLQFFNFSLQSSLTQARLSQSWVDMREDLSTFNELVSTVQGTSDCAGIIRELRGALEKHGLSYVSMMTIHNGLWDAVFDMKKYAITEVSMWDMNCPEALLTSGSLLKATVDISKAVFDHELFFRIVQANICFQELNFSYSGHNVQYHAEHIIRIWHDSSRPFRLNLLDRMWDGQGRVIAQLVIKTANSERPGNRLFNAHSDNISLPMYQQQTVDASRRIQVLEWDCDHVFGPLSDYSASLLDMATQQHPSVLNLLSLDITRLSRDGLASVQNILHRSRLEHLNIVCTRFDPTMTESISQVLGSVQWPSLKSLVLSGNNIDEWIKLWELSPVVPQLLCLHVQGTGSAEQELSHTSVLFLHQLVYAASLLELHLEHIQLQDKRDWVFVVESADPVLLKTYGLVGSSYIQFMSTKEAVDCYLSKFMKA